MSLRLKGIDFGPIFCAVGARGFFGEGYPFHRYWKHFGMDWSDTGFAGKTLTLLPRPGNMPLHDDGMTPREWFPQCIWGSPFHGGEMLNAVGLSNFGASFYLSTGRYYQIRNPFFLSMMPLAGNSTARKEELRDFCRLLRPYFPFTAPVALQINFGCPNTGHDLEAFAAEMITLTTLAKSELGSEVPIVLNVNALMPTHPLIEASYYADALWIGNTIPFGSPCGINWSRFGKGSPLRRRGMSGDGGLSSHDCLALTIKKVRELRNSGVRIPIVGGNGIRSPEDVEALDAAGCDAVFIGSIATVRPWNMRAVIRAAHSLL